MTTLLNPDPALTFGPLNLIGTDADQTANGYKFEALGTDADFGNPVPVEQAVISWLQDGALIALTRHDNRQMYLKVVISADDSEGLATGEEAFMLQTGQPNTLIWTPPDGLGEPCVFDVVMSHIELVTDDQAELYLERTYGLRIQAAPFARAIDLTSVTVPAPSGTQVLTLVDNCSSATGWTQTVTPFGGSPTTTAALAGGGTIHASTTMFGTGPSNPLEFTLKRTGLSQSLSGKPYVRFEITDFASFAYAAGVSGLRFKINGLVVPIAAQVGTVYWFDTSALGIGTLSSIEATALGYYGHNYTGVLNANQVDVSNILGEVGTKRQLSRTLTVAGSARTQGNLALEDPTASLGSVLVYTSPAVSGVASPNLRQYLTGSGTTTTDAATVSGATNDMGDNFGDLSFDIPASSLNPGGYILLARMKYSSNATKTMNWGSSSKAGGASGGYLVSGSGVGAAVVAVALSTSFQIYSLGKLNLPTVKLGTGGYVNIGIYGGSAGLIFDEAWLFNIESGDLTWVECGTLTPHPGGDYANRLFLDSPSITSPRPAVYLGTAADRSDQCHAIVSKMNSFGSHKLVPPLMNVFTVTSNSQAAALTLSYYRRSHTHVVAA